MQNLPDIDPREHALESRSCGEEFTFHLVSHDGRYYAWTVRPWDDGDHACEMPSLEAARQFLDSEFAFLLTITDWGERVASTRWPASTTLPPPWKRSRPAPSRPPARLDPATLQPPVAQPAWSAGVMFAIDAGAAAGFARDAPGPSHRHR